MAAHEMADPSRYEDTMDLQQAIEVALDFEHRVRDHYRKGAVAIEDPRGKKVFETLAAEEQGHVEYLEQRQREWQSDGKVTAAELGSILPAGTAWIATAKAELERKPEQRVADGDEIELLKIALELEKKTSAFYRDLVGKLQATERKLFERFLEIEDGHVTIVQAELDSVQGLGFWFDVMEFQLEAG